MISQIIPYAICAIVMCFGIAAVELNIGRGK